LALLDAPFKTMNSPFVADGKVTDPPKQNGRVSTAGPSQLLCERFSEWRYESTPSEVTRMAKLFVIDTLGVIAAASKAEAMQTLSAPNRYFWATSKLKMQWTVRK